jgi:hypothetical protein
MRMPESPHKVSLDHALAGEASAREDAVIGLSCHAGVVRFISEDCGLFASHVKNLTNGALRGCPLCALFVSEAPQKLLLVDISRS